MQRSIVIKLGGAALSSSTILSVMAQEVKRFRLANWRVLVVHGGGPEINRQLAKHNIKAAYHDGIRITDRKTLTVVESVLSGLINKQIVAAFLKAGLKTVGLSAKDGAIITAVPLKTKAGAVDYGLVGQVEGVDLELLNSMDKAGFVVVLSPVSFGCDCKTYNVNADMVAGCLAASMKADILVFLTDVAGILIDGKQQLQMNSQQIKHAIMAGKIKAGMIPKAEALIDSLQRGAKRALIISEMAAASLFAAANDQSTGGTWIKT